MAVSEPCGRLSIYGLLLFLPLINLFVLFTFTYIPEKLKPA